MNPKQPIAIFDSGIGSYSVVRVLRQLLPNEDIVYFADRANFPYGQKTHSELANIVKQTIKYLKNNWYPKIIIIASNTPSIQILHELTEDVPIIGVFPPIELAAKLSKTKHIVILATKGSVNSREIDDFIKNKHLPSRVIVTKVNASDLVSLVEPGTFQTDKALTRATISSVLKPVLKADPRIDVMTLSSTHLPFLIDMFESLYPGITFIDPAKAIALEVKDELSKKDLLNLGPGTLRVITSVDKAGKLSASDLQAILERLGLRIKVQTI